MSDKTVICDLVYGSFVTQFILQTDGSIREYSFREWKNGLIEMMNYELRIIWRPGDGPKKLGADDRAAYYVTAEGYPYAAPAMERLGASVYDR